ncbi:homeobox protein unc-4 homolog [Choloepus didactylus]|uniref:homeobox protein unc-4 homolog n=1 Tax=Choloepus didactylus TaxID=27675 RepID=UPI0018A08587|nr:homeobox protein unc-4 homolog [Choloepus didactylus]
MDPSREDAEGCLRATASTGTRPGGSGTTPPPGPLPLPPPTAREAAGSGSPGQGQTGPIPGTQAPRPGTDFAPGLLTGSPVHGRSCLLKAQSATPCEGHAACPLLTQPAELPPWTQGHAPADPEQCLRQADHRALCPAARHSHAGPLPTGPRRVSGVGMGSCPASSPLLLLPLSRPGPLQRPEGATSLRGPWGRGPHGLGTNPSWSRPSCSEDLGRGDSSRGPGRGREAATLSGGPGPRAVLGPCHDPVDNAKREDGPLGLLPRPPSAAMMVKPRSGVGRPHGPHPQVHCRSPGRREPAPSNQSPDEAPLLPPFPLTYRNQRGGGGHPQSPTRGQMQGVGPQPSGGE